ncbi:MAG: SMC family ATPase, partial [Actinomycetota bacterium]|nr:SMC family ATPase [Actinomycetota bacterium]
MRPLRLEMKGLRSYRERVELDLSGGDLFAIVGDTGSGKSSILEAMVFALYNGTTWGGRETTSLISGEGDGTMSVTLEFAADGKRWRVFRRICEGSSPPSMHRLECLTPGEDGFEALNGATHVDRHIRELVGLERQAFVTSVILPQGRFQELLHASGAEKTGILKGIFRLGAIGTVRGRARDRREAERDRENGLLEDRNRFMPDPAGTIRESSRLEGELAPTLEKLRASWTAAEDAAKNLRRISSEREDLLRSREGLAGAAERAAAVAEDLPSLVALAGVYEGEEGDLLSAREEARAAHEEACRERERLLDGGIGPDGLSAALHRARALPEMLEGLRALGEGVGRGGEE